MGELGLAIKLLVTRHHELQCLRHTRSREQEWQSDRGKAENVSSARRYGGTRRHQSTKNICLNYTMMMVRLALAGSRRDAHLALRARAMLTCRLEKHPQDQIGKMSKCQFPRSSSRMFAHGQRARQRYL